jgi:hypothetical protein
VQMLLIINRHFKTPRPLRSNEKTWLVRARRLCDGRRYSQHLTSKLPRLNVSSLEHISPKGKISAGRGIQARYFAVI